MCGGLEVGIKYVGEKPKWHACSKGVLEHTPKTKSTSHATVPSLWFEGWLVSLATAYIYSALVYLATVLFLHQWQLVVMAPVAVLGAKLLLPLIGDITAFISEVRLSGGANALKSKAGESLLESSAINLTPFWIQGSSPLITISDSTDLEPYMCVCVCVCVSQDTAKKEVALFQTISIEGHGNYYPLFKTFSECFPLYAIALGLRGVLDKF